MTVPESNPRNADSARKPISPEQAKAIADVSNDDEFRTILIDHLQAAAVESDDPEDAFRRTISMNANLRDLSGFHDGESTMVIDSSPLERIKDPTSAQSDAADGDAEKSTRILKPDELAATRDFVSDYDATRDPANTGAASSGGRSPETRSIESILNVENRDVGGFPFKSNADADYQVLSKVGQGAMGVVYSARQTSLNREITFKTLKTWWEALAEPLREKLPGSQYVKAVNELREHGSLSPEITQQLRTKMDPAEFEKFSGHLRSSPGRTAGSKSDQAIRDLFLSEAVVTSNLVHPNIVPIHDMGQMDDGTLFYSMKWVRGTPWEKCIEEMTLTENLNILMRVCDAVAFAHHNGVVNRDLKPENVMVGEFGEVMVLDWGLAVPTEKFAKKDQITSRARAGAGTPVYMAPELVTGPMEKIGPHSDIYLLGAMLFEAITGEPPHDFSDTRALSPRDKTLRIIKVVGQNIIRDPGFSHELIDIAMKAMSTDPADRYATVKDFQTAIRTYQRHEESLRLCKRGDELLDGAEQRVAARGYTDFQNASALYEESLREWPENAQAAAGLRRVKLSFSEVAYSKGDYDLGIHVLDGERNPTANQQREKLLKARRRRAGLKWGMVSALAVILIGGTASWIQISSLLGDRTEARREIAEATKATRLAKRAEIEAKLDADQAIEARKNATLAANVARSEKEMIKRELKADRLKLAELGDEIEKVNANYASVKVSFEEVKTELDTAEEKLKAAKRSQEAAEEGLVLANRKTADARKQLAETDKLRKAAEIRQQMAEFRSQKVQADGFIRAGRYSDAIPILEQLLKADNEFVNRNRIPLRETLRQARSNSSRLDSPINTGAISSDGNTIAIAQNSPGKNTGRLVVQPVSTLRGSEKSNRHIAAFTAAGRLDSVAMSANGARLVGASGNQLLLWNTNTNQNEPIVLGEHKDSINIVRLSAGGRYVLSGSSDRTVKIHDIKTRSEVAALRQESAIRDLIMLPDQSTIVMVLGEGPQSICTAVQARRVNQRFEFDRLGQLKLPASARVPFSHVAVSPNGSHLALANRDNGDVYVLPKRSGRSSKTSTSKSKRDAGNRFPFEFPAEAPPETWLLSGHSRRVNSIAFSADAQNIVTASDDYTLAVWKRQGREFEKTHVLQGHGGAVEMCRFLPDEPTKIVSMGRDRYVRLWDLNNYQATRKQILDSTNPEDRAKQDEMRTKLPTRDRRSARATHDTTGRTNIIRVAARLPGDVTDPNLVRTASAQTTPGLRNAAPQSATQEKKKSSLNPREVIIDQHDGGVLSAGFSRSGRQILTASRDRTARVWAADSGPNGTAKNQRTVRLDRPEQTALLQEGHRFNVNTLLFLPPRGERLVTATPGHLCIWDANPDENGAGQELARLDEPGRYGAIAASADGKWLLSSAAGNTAQLWDVAKAIAQENPRPVVVLKKQHRFPVTAVAVSPDGTKLLTGDRRGRLVLWSAPEGKFISEVKQAHTADQISSLRFISKTQFLSAGYDGRIQLWTIDETSGTATSQREYLHGPGFVTHLATSPDGQQFLSASRQRDGKVWQSKLRLWEIDNETSERTIRISNKTPTKDSPARAVKSVDWSADGESVVVSDGIVLTFLNTNSWRVIKRLGESSGGIVPASVAFKPDAKRPDLLASGNRIDAHLWSSQTGQHLASFRAHAAVFSASFSADEKTVATASRSIRLFDIQSSVGRSLFKIENPHQGAISHISFSPRVESQKFISASIDGSACLWDWNTKLRRAKLDRRILENSAPIRSAAWSRDGREVITVGDDGKPRIWNVLKKTAPTVLETNIAGQSAACLSCAFSAQDDAIAVGGYDVATEQSIGWLWKRASDDGEKTWKLHTTISGHGQGGITAMSFTTDGNYLISGGDDGAVFAWDWLADTDSSAEPLTALNVFSFVRRGQTDAHNARITSIDTSANGRIVTSSEDGTAIVWPPFARQ